MGNSPADSAVGQKVSSPSSARHALPGSYLLTSNTGPSSEVKKLGRMEDYMDALFWALFGQVTA